MRVSEFDYHLPSGLIAVKPLKERDSSRLLVLNKATGEIQHKYFKDCPDYFNKGDVLVLNNTKVLPLRILGIKEGGTGKVEILLIEENPDRTWKALLKYSNRFKEGTRILIQTKDNSGFPAEIMGFKGNGIRDVRFEYKGDIKEVLGLIGSMPLPPYILKRRKLINMRSEDSDDFQRYQTVFAKKDGAIAAPTAGMHFTGGLLDDIKAKGVKVVELTLHVGTGTFAPIRTETVEEHNMQEEYFEINKDSADIINNAKKNHNKIIAVGTTTARALESAVKNEIVEPVKKKTNLFIYPGYKFNIADTLITNFHIPKSTLLMLVSAFASKEKMFNAYSEAIKEKYRFYSYGDAMLII